MHVPQKYSHMLISLSEWDYHGKLESESKQNCNSSLGNINNFKAETTSKRHLEHIKTNRGIMLFYKSVDILLYFRKLAKVKLQSP